MSVDKNCTSMQFYFFPPCSVPNDNNKQFFRTSHKRKHHMKKHYKTLPRLPTRMQTKENMNVIRTSLECNLGDISVCSPDELNVHWNVSAGGEASTSQRNCTVSCFNAPNNSSLSFKQTGASAKEHYFCGVRVWVKEHLKFFFKWNIF